MSKAIDKARADGFYEGVRMAYEDCAKLADAVAEKMAGFANTEGVDPAFANTAKTILHTIAKGIREKIVEADAIVQGAREPRQ